MTKTRIIAENKNYKAIDIGSLNELSQHEFIHPEFKTVDKSRLFIGELLETTGSEISFRELPPNTVIPFLHKHNKHEEIYIILKGSGQFQVDSDIFKIQEGSVVKVSAAGNRTLSNDEDFPMIYMVVQSCSNTLKAYNVKDGCRVEGEIKIFSK